jgi:hypothetical protein
MFTKRRRIDCFNLDIVTKIYVTVNLEFSVYRTFSSSKQNSDYVNLVIKPVDDIKRSDL